MFQVVVNATSANISVGFDVLGLALDIPNKFTFEKSNEFGFKGFEEEFSNVNNNLVYDSYLEVFKVLNKEPIPVIIGFEGRVPVSRGLGSSSSLIVGGVFAANYILGSPLTKEECFAICAKIEGHPDNVAPAIYGSLVASYKKGEKYYPNIYSVNKNLKFITVIPPFKLSTEAARGVLPKELSYKDIVSNLSRIVNIPRAFETGNVELLIDLFEDKMHEPYRSKLIKGYDELKKICSDNNCAFAISGSGSTMLIISKDYSIIDKIKHMGYQIETPEVGEGVTIKEL